GPDNIPAEALKADVAATARILHILFNKIWDEEQVQTDWKEGLLIKILKKGDLSKCDNYRGITLLSIPGNVSTMVLLNRMKDCVDTQLRDQQAGFRKDRSCTDQIATLRIIVGQSLEWNSSLHINFIDYEKAFDSVDRTTLWKLLRHYGVPQKIVNIMQNSYGGLHCKTVHGGQLTKSFEVKTGVRQGCLLSPFLFLLMINWIMKTSTSEGKRGIQWTARMQLNDLDFADDLALLSQTQQQMLESTQLRHKTSLHMESSRPKEKRKAKEDITPGNGNRHEKNEQELDGTRKEGPGRISDITKSSSSFLLKLMESDDFASSYSNLSILRLQCVFKLSQHLIKLWTAQYQLDDLNFADDLSLPLHTHEQMQIKTTSVAAVSESVGLNIRKEKSNIFKYNKENSNSVTLDGETLEDVEFFTYMGSIIDKQGGSDADVKTRIGKARAAFL
ncbi:unnamed protein product, partial [Schistosoma curassoni]|uniref:Reverse transcriptase domain-containing protein n=1 Tax=Schistosoma curassoni TaxID=6186 RepID=A0A183JH81_9TREM